MGFSFGVLVGLRVGTTAGNSGFEGAVVSVEVGVGVGEAPGRIKGIGVSPNVGIGVVTIVGDGSIRVGEGAGKLAVGVQLAVGRSEIG